MTSVNTGPGGNLDLDSVFSYHPPTPEQIGLYEAIRGAGYDLAEVITLACPPSPDRSKAISAVREAVMWANASIACNPSSDQSHEDTVDVTQKAQNRSQGRWARIVAAARERIAG